VRRLVTWFAVVAAVAWVAISGASAGPKPIPLSVGGSAFWPGSYVEDVHTHLPDQVACPTGGCYDYPLQVAAGGYRLRVAIDSPDRAQQYTLELLDPTGAVATSADNRLASQFDVEVFAAKPAAGLWTARVIPQDVHNSSFRLRAKLEKGPVTYKHKTQLLPDLAVTPPYEFSFIAPASPAAGVAPDYANPPLAVAGQHPLSCTPDEMETDGVSRCLRFTVGPRNMGTGPFEIDYNPSDGLTTPGPAYQRIYYSDGTTTTRPAGQFMFHPQHGHYHYLDILNFQLYKVSPPSRAMVPAGSGKKLGFCPADEQFADWTAFTQAPGGTPIVGGSSSSPTEPTFTANCGFTTSEASLGLNTGWGDVYRWQRPGQYVDFAGDGDGYYVLQVIADIKNHVLETNENNNVGYAYVHVVGDRVTLLERGQGTSPWDKRKTVFTDQ
jgi:hypothetical protein